MKKYLILALAVLPLISIAQGFNGDTGCDCFSNKSKGDKIPFYLGLNSGYFLQNYSSPLGQKSNIGLPYGGLVAGVHATRFLSVQSGISYSYVKNVDVHNPETLSQIPIDNARMSVQYIEIPLELQLRLIVYRNFTVYLQPGIYNNLVIKRDYVSDFSSSSESRIKFNRMYAGGGIGFGLIANRKWMFFAIPEFHTSLVVDETIIPDFTSRFGARVGVTYTFRKKK
jgi:hypothetical protein